MIISTSITQNKENISKESLKQVTESITIKQKRLGYFFNRLYTFLTTSQRIFTKSHKSLFNMLRKRADLANTRNYSPHDLQRTFVSDLLEAGARIDELINQGLLHNEYRRIFRAKNPGDEYGIGLRHTMSTH
jgi:integrase